jgi:hypothetical protein
MHTSAHANEQTLVAFGQKAFKNAGVATGDVQGTDLLANPYRPKDAAERARVIVKDTISLRTNDVERVDRTEHKLNDLIQQVIVLTTSAADFQFSKLNDIKAGMLRDATQNARDAAQQFASDAGSSVGSIESANQVFFSIVSRDAGAQGQDSEPDFSNVGGLSQSTIDKKVRLVVTLTYYLEK